VECTIGIPVCVKDAGPIGEVCSVRSDVVYQTPFSPCGRDEDVYFVQAGGLPAAEGYRGTSEVDMFRNGVVNVGTRLEWDSLMPSVT
jgi:hypothetical protein